ncbi:MAG: type II toxin-antitoxin system RelE/ParE family toxin [Candidatus Coatesbacteria bacterium]|nr:type II toxin-antitoxin system RelE/ParE family toxin [Candidatus Coatesbacteria bacterium]
MNPFTVYLTPEAKRDVERLDPSILSRVLDKLEWIGRNADLIDHHQLKGLQWGNSFRYRLGDYRIIYQMNHHERQVTILKIAHRREIYRSE